MGVLHILRSGGLLRHYPIPQSLHRAAEMGSWGAILLALLLCLAAALLRRRAQLRRLPPGPPPLPLLGNLPLLLRSKTTVESFLEDLLSKYGPIVTVHLGPRPTIFVSDRDLAHEMLVQHGAIFADRPPPSPAATLLSAERCQINAAPYGPLWRLLRRNLATEMLHPARVRLSAVARGWALRILLDKLHSQSTSPSAAGVVVPRETFIYSMFCLLVFLCFGERLDEATVRNIESAQRDLLYFVQKLAAFDFAPRLSKYLLRGRWKRLLELRQRQRDVFLPLIRARREQKEARVSGENSLGFSYLDSILDLEIPEGKGRKPNDEEIVSLCSEFLNGGTDTTSTALEWIMANVAKDKRVQEKLAEEVGEETMEEDLKGMPYLKAVVLEGLRRHPPAHFVLTHATTEEIEVGGYAIPKGTRVNFAVRRMSADGGTWPQPMEFRPERFLPGGEGEAADVAGSKRIMMMPFGVGRRICPGMGLALLHLEYFVANLVGAFRWEPAEEGEMDLSEKPVFTIVMKKPLRVRISPRCS